MRCYITHGEIWKLSVSYYYVYVRSPYWYLMVHMFCCIQWRYIRKDWWNINRDHVLYFMFTIRIACAQWKVTHGLRFDDFPPISSTNLVKQSAVLWPSESDVFSEIALPHQLCAFFESLRAWELPLFCFFYISLWSALFVFFCSTPFTSWSVWKRRFVVFLISPPLNLVGCTKAHRFYAQLKQTIFHTSLQISKLMVLINMCLGINRQSPTERTNSPKNSACVLRGWKKTIVGNCNSSR